jgi:hypothetical protein
MKTEAILLAEEEVKDLKENPNWEEEDYYDEPL